MKRVNPSALVPTLIPIDEEGKADESKVRSFITDSLYTRHVHQTDFYMTTIWGIKNKSVYESLITIDYVDAIAQAPEILKLVPSDPYLAAKCRYWADKVNRECCSPYYGVLVRTDEKEQRDHFGKLVGGLKEFSKEIEKHGDGRTFLGGGRLTNVDIALMPW